MQKTLNDIIKSAQKLGYDIDTRPYALNLIGVRNSAATDQKKFDDLIAYFYYDENRRLVGRVAAATTDPATYFLVNPMNPKGAAILKSGQYKDSWGLGLHRGQYTALVQTKPLPVIRDNDRNALINYFAPTTTGLYGINIHRASRGKNNVAVIGKDSAGCQVFRDEKDYDSMIRMAKTSRDKYGNKFSYTLIDERDTIKLRNTALLIAGIGILGFAAYLYFKKNK
jgi:hypothetical protein